MKAYEVTRADAMKKNTNTFKEFVMQFDMEFATEMYTLSVDNSVDAFVTTLNFAI